MTPCAKPECQGEALGVGRWPFLCLDDALVLAGLPRGAKVDRASVLAEHEAIHRAFKAANRQLEDLAPPRPVHAASVEALEPELMAAALLTMQALGARPVRTERRYGDLPPMVVPIGVEHDPLQPCGLCGTTSPRIKRAPFGVAPHVWVWCVAEAGCKTRMRAAKAA